MEIMGLSCIFAMMIGFAMVVFVMTAAAKSNFDSSPAPKSRVKSRVEDMSPPILERSSETFLNKFERNVFIVIDGNRFVQCTRSLFDEPIMNRILFPIEEIYPADADIQQGLEFRPSGNPSFDYENADGDIFLTCSHKGIHKEQARIEPPDGDWVDTPTSVDEITYAKGSWWIMTERGLRPVPMTTAGLAWFRVS